MVEQGFATLAVMAQSWESFVAEESCEDDLKQKQESDRAVIGRCFSSLLEDTWIRERVDEMVGLPHLVSSSDLASANGVSF